jgi:hypothetical protein
VEFGVSHTDNVFLQATPGDVDENILGVSPYFGLIHESPGVDAELNYKIDWYRYTGLSSQSTYHLFDGIVTGKWLDDSLKIALGAIRKQVLRDPGVNIPAGRLPLSGGLVDRDELFINPRYERELSQAIGMTLDYRFATISHDENTIQENDNQIGRFVLDNYARRQGFTWALRYDLRKTKYEISAPFEYRKATGEMGFWVSERMRLFGSGGKESPWDVSNDSSLKDSFWEGGVAFDAGEKLSAEFAVGERSFGHSWRGELDYTFRRGSVRLSYSEDPTTIGFEVDRLIDGGDAEFNSAPDDFLTRPGRIESFISERLDFQYKIDFRRTRVAITVFSEDRVNRFDANRVQLSNQDQSGVSASVAWQLASRTELVAAGSLLTRKDSITSESEFRRGTLTANYQLGRKTQASIVYDYSEQQPSSITAGRDYAANTVSLLLNYGF